MRKTDYAKFDCYDVWLPQLAPSAALLAWIKQHPDIAQSWKQFEKQYVQELSTPDNLRLLDLLAALSKGTDSSVGCYCEDETKCHRSILRRMLAIRRRTSSAATTMLSFLWKGLDSIEPAKERSLR